MQDKVYDMCIIGGGIAGRSAAIRASKLGLDVAIFDKAGFEQSITKINEDVLAQIEILPNYSKTTETNFSKSIFNQMTEFENLNIISNEIVLINYRYGLFRLSTKNNELYCSKSIIFATGTAPKSVNLASNDIYYCNNNLPDLKAKNAIICGSSNIGISYALALANQYKNIFICDKYLEMHCDPVLVKKINEINNIHWLPNTEIKEIRNGKDNEITSVLLSTGTTLKCSIIIMDTELIPQTNIVKPFAKLDEFGYIIAPDCITTLIPGVFAAGECRSNSINYVANKIADGINAAEKAADFVKKNYK